MSKHTPGPWLQFGNMIGSHVGKRAICRLLDGTTTDAPALDIGSKCWQEQMANARLIAAAPAMLASLKEAYNEDHGGYSGAQVKAAILAADPDAFDADGYLK